jgi:hypothetical protein
MLSEWDFGYSYKFFTNLTGKMDSAEYTNYFKHRERIWHNNCECDKYESAPLWPIKSTGEKEALMD